MEELRSILATSLPDEEEMVRDFGKLPKEVEGDFILFDKMGALPTEGLAAVVAARALVPTGFDCFGVSFLVKGLVFFCGAREFLRGLFACFFGLGSNSV